MRSLNARQHNVDLTLQPLATSTGIGSTAVFDDAQYDAESTHSPVSPPLSLTDGSTLENQNPLTIIGALVELFTSDNVLIPLLHNAPNSPHVSEDYFTKKLQKQFELLATGLRIEAKDWLQEFVSTFIRKKARKIAQRIKLCVFEKGHLPVETLESSFTHGQSVEKYLQELTSGKELLSSKGGLAQELGPGAEEEGEPSEFEGATQKAIQFIRGSRAIEDFCTRLHHIVHSTSINLAAQHEA